MVIYRLIDTLNTLNPLYITLHNYLLLLLLFIYCILCIIYYLLLLVVSVSVSFLLIQSIIHLYLNEYSIGNSKVIPSEIPFNCIYKLFNVLFLICLDIVVVEPMREAHLLDEVLDSDLAL